MKLIVFSTLTVPTIAAASQSHSAEVIRCNALAPSGSYQPVLIVIEPKNRTTVFMGNEGLTRKIYFKDRSVVAYVLEKMGISILGQRDETTHCAGRTGADGSPTEAPAAAPDPVTPTVDTTTLDPVAQASLSVAPTDVK